MNSRNKIILGCLSLLVIASVGYALFSEKITINGSAKAKKEDLDIVTTCNVVDPKNLTVQEQKMENELGLSGLKTEGEGKCNIKDNTVSINGDMKKPTDQVYFSLSIKNNGKFPVILKQLNSSNNLDFGSSITKGDSMYIEGVNNVIDGKLVGDGINGLMSQYVLYELNDNDEPIYSYQTIPYENSSDSSIEKAKITLQPNKKLYIIVFFNWDGKMLHNMGVKLPMPTDQGLKMNYDIQFLFEQKV